MEADMHVDSWLDPEGNPIMVPVPAKALYDVVTALLENDHRLQEMIVISRIPPELRDHRPTPIERLWLAYEEFKEEFNG